jgi:cytochrome c oxidase subunit 2
MTALLTFIIVLFVAVAMWQMVKIFDLAQVGASNNQIADDKDNRVNGYLMMGFLVFIYAITIASFMYLGDLPLLVSNSASDHGSGIDNLMIISMVVIFIVQIVTQFLLHYFAFKYKGEKGKKSIILCRQ